MTYSDFSVDSRSVGFEGGISPSRFPKPEYDDDYDEVREVRKVARRDEINVVIWRSIAVTVLILNAVAVTVITYLFLQRQQTDNFETLFEQIGQTVADAAHYQQIQGHRSIRALADTVTSVSALAPGSWPSVPIPDFESYALHAMEQSNIEIIGLFPLVRQDQREGWEEFLDGAHKEIVEEAHLLRYENLDHLNATGFVPFIFEMTSEGNVTDIERERYFPMMQLAPAPFSYYPLNWNIETGHPQAFQDMMSMKSEIVLSPVELYGGTRSLVYNDSDHDVMHEHITSKHGYSREHIHSLMYTPVHARVHDQQSEIVAILGSGVAWDSFMAELIEESVTGIQVILENTCGQIYTYEIDGPRVELLGIGDHHEIQYDHMEITQDLSEGLFTNASFEELAGHCRYSVRVFPTSSFERSLDPFVPQMFAIVVASTFSLVVVVFLIYDMFVQRRNDKMVANAAQSNAIVSALFPRSIRDRLINNDRESMATASNLKHFMTGTINSTDVDDKPLADLFLECTVLFADIAGFTAWSSVREPTQVFTILEKMFGAFDHIAKLRRVFKVETVGDCYVAATGIPDYREDHAVVMVRFARDILAKMHVFTTQLETTLGPDTGDLSLRVGIHTGPVTAGVLRGERARFQLFGDTMNVCSRIESTGVAGRIHVSSDTAECLQKNGRGHWLVKRETKVEAKGKGELQTYWIGANVEMEGLEGSEGGSTRPDTLSRTDAVFEPSDHGRMASGHDARLARLVEWNVEMLSQILRHIVSRRRAKVEPEQRPSTIFFDPGRNWGSKNSNDQFIPLDEVEEIIELPEFDLRVTRRQDDPDSIKLPDVVTSQLRHYVATISGMYRDNSFHNFEHASHVTMSVIKLLSRIVAPSELMEEETSAVLDKGKNLHATLHDHTYGITSDPLTQFSCAFAAMIHDVDHTGVPNAQLVKEETRIAQVYNNRSVAEQNSLVLAWELLLRDEYDEFRCTLCADQAELDRFRQLVVNAVMATDIADKDLKALRNARWDKAFKETEFVEDEHTAVNRKATIVIEHLIQASDVAHTMQHWHVYRKWNENFFRECYTAYLHGRASDDPSHGWYQGELGFFDFYIIPLAKKLKDCGVFGKSSDEYLTYALENRSEWARRGEDVVAEMITAIDNEDLEM